MPNQPTKTTVFLKAKLQAYIHKEKPGMYVSYCPALDLYSQGDDHAEAKKNIHEASEMLIEGCLEGDTLHEVLQDCGFTNVQIRPPVRPRKPRKIPPEFTNSKPFQFFLEVPMLVYGR